jgi:hypothetical protein
MKSLPAKKSVFSLAKEIYKKDEETWKEAISRASLILKSESETNNCELTGKSLENHLNRVRRRLI